MSVNLMGKVRLGSADWEVPGWVGSFYPGDMPEDWRLTYYNTQYSCVWLAYSRWGKASAEQVRAWRDDTHADFRFVLEQPPTLEAQARTVLEVLGSRVAKICALTDASLIWFDARTDLKSLTRQIQGRAPGSDCFLLSRDGDLATLEKVGTLLGLLGL